MMPQSVDPIIAYHCAPAICGIKVANLVALQGHVASLTETVQWYNEAYNSLGLHFYALCDCQKRRLLLVFRSTLLERYLRRPEHMTFLTQYGYNRDSSLSEWLGLLSERIRSSCEFPHEIGLFLGYPLSDVQSFIDHKGQDYLLCGEWKVYSKAAFAKRVFQTYASCRKHCRCEMARGKPLKALIQHTA